MLPTGETGRVNRSDESRRPARVFVASALRDVLDELELNVPGTIAGLDPEFLHALRVAVRRSRSILKVAGDTLPEGTAEAFAPTLKWVGDLTTPMRDLDVHLLEYEHDVSRLRAYAAEDLVPMREHLVRHRAGLRRVLVRGLRSARFTRFLTDWRQALDDALRAPAKAGEPGGRPVVVLAAERIANADRRLIRLGGTIRPDSDPALLHRLRKRGKELRYTLELFAPAVDAEAQRSVVKQLKALQDVLGVFQDSEVQRHALRQLAEQMVAEQNAHRTVPVVTLLAMGELATRLDEDQRRARMDFEQTFARFARPRVRRQVRLLTATHTAMDGA